MLIKSGFTILIVLVVISSKGQNLDSTVTLNEFILVEKQPIKVTADTVSFVIDSFSRNPHATTEEAIKRLPGVEVTDGKIIVQGKEVKKVFVNGKEYNSAEFNTLTQNLPADVLDKIEFADWVDEAAQFTGVMSKREDKVMHLKFKKQYTQGITGQAAAGAGSKERSQGGLFANYMNNQSRITFTGNIGNTGTASRSSNLAAGGSVQGITEEARASLNFTTDLSSKLDLTGVYDVIQTRNFHDNYRLRTTFISDDSSLFQQNNSSHQTKRNSHRLNLRSLYRFSERARLITNVNLSYQQQSGFSTDKDASFKDANLNEMLFSRNMESSNQSNTPTVNFSTQLQKKFIKTGRTLTAKATAQWNKNDGENMRVAENLYGAQTTATDFTTQERAKQLSGTLGFQYTEPISRYGTVIASYEYLWRNENTGREVWATQNEQTHFDTAQSRTFTNYNREQRAGIFLQYRKEKIEAKAGLEVQYFNRILNRANSESVKDIGQYGFNYFPALETRWRLSEKRIISFSYNGNINTPTIRQLQPIPDYTDSLNIYMGNEHLLPEIRNSLQLYYNNIHPKTKNISWIRLHYRFVNGQIINRTVINASSRITTPVNASGAYNASVAMGYTFQILPKTVRATAATDFDLNKNISYTNDRLLSLLNYKIAPNIRLQIHNLKWYEGSVYYSYVYHNFRSSVAGNLVQTHQITQEGNFSLPLNVRLYYYLSYQHNKGYSNTINQDFVIFNAAIDKQFERPKGLSIRLQGFDVLNKFPTVQRNVGDNYIEDRSVNRLGRFYLLSVLYKFSYFGKL